MGSAGLVGRRSNIPLSTHQFGDVYYVYLSADVKEIIGIARLELRDRCGLDKNSGNVTL